MQTVIIGIGVGVGILVIIVVVIVVVVVKKNQNPFDAKPGGSSSFGNNPKQRPSTYLQVGAFE